MIPVKVLSSLQVLHLLHTARIPTEGLDFRQDPRVWNFFNYYEGLFLPGSAGTDKPASKLDSEYP